MTHLILDIGNTHAKAAVVVDGTVVTQSVADSADQLSLMALCATHGVDSAIASVVGRQPDFETLDYDTPETLGMDRVAAVVGARQMAPDGALLVVDAGSCITIDLLDENDHYRGGAILPGIHMRLNALHHYTAALPLVTLTPDERQGLVDTPTTGRSTRESIVAGVCSACLFEIQGFINHHQQSHPSLKLFLTGGDADFFANRLFFPKFATQNLLTIGLDKILEINT